VTVSLEVLKVTVEMVETLVPDLPVGVDPRRCVLEWRSLEAAGAPLGVLASDHETSSLEDLQVLRDRLQRHGERLGQLADRRLALGQPSEDRPASGIGEGSKRAAERVVCHHMINQLVYQLIG
jgi:hypothetical protein